MPCIYASIRFKNELVPPGSTAAVDSKKIHPYITFQSTVS